MTRPRETSCLGFYARRRRSRRSSALVITLIFVLLLTILLVTFLGHVLATRKVTNSNANSTKVSLFSHGAINTVLGDLREEMIDGSTASQPASGQWVYFPLNPANMVPQRVGGSTSYPNLVKISYYNAPFYTIGTTNGVARASNSSSLTPSVDGRYMTPARWNKALFLPRATANATSATDFTPLNANEANNTWTNAPAWVLVSRSGSNPVAWSSSLQNSISSNTNYVVGRYAYAIYDEGGLLDANAVGYPSGTPTTASLTNTPAYRYNEAFADLTQLPGIADLANPTLENQVITELVKARNYTTWNASTPTFADNYYRSALLSPNGFLTVGNTSLVNGRSDLLFSSRQDLLQFMLQALPQLGQQDGTFTSSTGTLLQQQLPTTLQYLTHFSRALDQPSVTPPAGRPMIVGQPTSGGNTAYGNDNLINPAFLNVRVVSTGTRNDGVTPAVIGEPLVKTRFALNRLAWITYKGPIADDSGNLSTDPDLQSIITQLQKLGLTAAFLQRGGPTNIQKYFGLSWDKTTGSWRYNVHNGSGSGSGAIMRLGDIPAQGREADFVELLKATINVGSIAKGCYSDTSNGASFPPNYQFVQDTNTDYAIIQLTANIIDQFDLDGYPTHILFDPGGGIGPQEFDGVENLPYAYGCRVIGAEAVSPVPEQPFWGGQPVVNTGACVAMIAPEIWNPHDQNCQRCAFDSSGNPLKDGSGNPLYPTSFRIVADTTDPQTLAGNANGSTLTEEIETLDASTGFSSANAQVNGTAPYTTPFNPPFTNFSGVPLPLTAASTEMDFNVPATTQGQGLFREPTLLMQPNVPPGSGLGLGPNNYMMSGGTNYPSVLGRLNGLVNANGTVSNNSNGERYFGMYLGTTPYQWWSQPIPPSTTGTVTTPGSPNGALICGAGTFDPGQTQAATFRMQAMDLNTGAMRTYDEKYMVAILSEAVSFNLAANDWSFSTSTAANGPATHFAVLGATFQDTSWDPRTTHFSSPTLSSILGGGVALGFEGPVTSPDNYGGLNVGSLDPLANAITSDRPDISSGFGGGELNSPFVLPSGFPNIAGWSPSTTSRPAGPFWHMGMISQNSTTYNGSGTRYSSDPQPAMSSGPQYYADADGVVRRAMGAYGATHNTTGMPMPTATTYSGGVGTPINTAYSSRPMVLNRPFASVAELGYVFSGTPWKNLNFFTPESGDGGLLDVFCVNETNPSALVAGKVNLNTQQYPVLQAIFSGAYKDALWVNTGDMQITSGTSGDAGKLAGDLVARTTGTASNGQSPPAAAGGAAPLENISDIVGRWTSGTNYDGFSADLTTAFSFTTDKQLQRMREAPIRALSACGQTRVWNLMIDLVAQTGRYPATASNLNNFVADAQQRLWVHVAIDRLTGQIIDEQIEVVHE